MSKSKPQTSTAETNTSNYIPEWLGATGQAAVERADALSYRPYDPYTGQTVAPPTGDTLAAYQGVRDLQGQGDPALAASYNAYNNLVGQARPQTADQLTAATNPLYFNFEQNVLDPSWKAYGNALGQTQAGFGNAQNQSQGYYGGAIGQNQGLLGNYLAANSPATAEQVGRNATALMSPYRDDVINPALAAGQQQLALAKQGISANANQVNAFGGSRAGVQEGVADAQTSLGTQQFIGNMLNTGWGQALVPAYNLANNASQQGYNAASLLSGQNFNAADRLAQQAYGAAGQLGTQQFNTAANLGGMLGLGYGNAASAGQGLNNTNFQAGLAAAGALPNVAQLQQGMDQRDASMLQASGMAQQNYQQQLDNAGLSQYYEGQNWPVQNLDLLLGALGGIPYSTQGTGFNKQNTELNKNVAGGVIGGALSGATTGAAVSGGNPYVAAAGALIGGIGGAS
jgi:hypothetical protein